jgi:hypothetical protein
MADEAIKTPADTTASDKTTPPDKKKRAPRRSKEEMAAAASAKSAKRSNKVSSSATVKTPTVKIAPAVEPSRVSAAPKSKSAAAGASVTGDGFADLLQLEEENKKLRLQLAEKLRAENADLRKRLG